MCVVFSAGVWVDCAVPLTEAGREIEYHKICVREKQDQKKSLSHIMKNIFKVVFYAALAYSEDNTTTRYFDLILCLK